MIPLFCSLDTNIQREEGKIAMVSIRFFSFVLVFILALIGESSARSQVMETKRAAERSGLVKPARKNLPRLGKEAYNAVPAAAEVENSRLKGRKTMLVKWNLGKKTLLSVEGADGEETAKISGAGHQSVGKSSHRGKGILNVNCELRNRNPHRHREAKMAGFTAFSADYHVPKSHPPKNN